MNAAEERLLRNPETIERLKKAQAERDQDVTVEVPVWTLDDDRKTLKRSFQDLRDAENNRRLVDQTWGDQREIDVSNKSFRAALEAVTKADLVVEQMKDRVIEAAGRLLDTLENARPLDGEGGYPAPGPIGSMFEGS